VKAPDSLKPSGREEERLLAEAWTQAGYRQHVAVIMDGNGRWAQRRHLPRIAGTAPACSPRRTVIETCARLKILHLRCTPFHGELAPPKSGN